MSSTSPGSSLKTFIEVARRSSPDTRPTLLRLLVDRVVEEGAGDATGAERLATLLPRLLAGVDTDAARAAAERLAARADLPASLVDDLARGPIAVAGPFLRLSPVLSETTLRDIAATGDAERLQAVSSRREVSPALAKHLASTVHHTREATPPPPPPVQPPMPDFFEASPEDRAAMLHRLVTRPPLPLAERVGAPGEGFANNLLAASKRGDRDALVVLVERALAVSTETATRIVEDETGQALAVAARALGLTFALLSRILFRIQPEVGRSSHDMARLADLFDSLPLSSAQHMVAIWRGPRRQAVARPAEDAPSMRDFAVPRPQAHAEAEPGEMRRKG